MIKEPITETLFWELVNKTNVGMASPGAKREGKTIRAAFLYFVDGGRSRAECGRLAGISRTAAARTINRLQEVYVDPERDIRHVCFNIPKDQVDDVTAFVNALRAS